MTYICFIYVIWSINMSYMHWKEIQMFNHLNCSWNLCAENIYRFGSCWVLSPGSVCLPQYPALSVLQWWLVLLQCTTGPVKAAALLFCGAKGRSSFLNWLFIEMERTVWDRILFHTILPERWRCDFQVLHWPTWRHTVKWDIVLESFPPSSSAFQALMYEGLLVAASRVMEASGSQETPAAQQQQQPFKWLAPEEVFSWWCSQDWQRIRESHTVNMIHCEL